MAGEALGNIQADFDHRLFELFAILRFLDDVALGANHLAAVFFQNPVGMQIHRRVEAGLAAEGRQQSTGAFFFDDLFDVLPRDRFDIRAISGVRVCHDRGGVGIHQHHFITFLTQRLACLRAGIVEFTGLPDHDGTGTDDQNLLNIVSTWHGEIPSKRWLMS